MINPDIKKNYHDDEINRIDTIQDSFDIIMNILEIVKNHLTSKKNHLKAINNHLKIAIRCFEVIHGNFDVRKNYQGGVIDVFHLINITVKIKTKWFDMETGCFNFVKKRFCTVTQNVIVNKTELNILLSFIHKISLWTNLKQESVL